MLKILYIFLCLSLFHDDFTAADSSELPKKATISEQNAASNSKPVMT